MTVIIYVIMLKWLLIVHVSQIIDEVLGKLGNYIDDNR